MRVVGMMTWGTARVFGVQAEKEQEKQERKRENKPRPACYR